MTKKLGNNFYTRPSGKIPKKNDQHWQVKAGQYLSVSAQNVSMIAGGGFLGWYLDKKLDTAPLLLILGIMTGAAAGFYYLIRSLKSIEKDSHD